MRSLTVWGCLASLSFAFAQQPAKGPEFEVASIKAADPNPSNRMFIGMSADRAMVKYTNITLRDCIRGAYRVADFQIVGPDWMTRTRFEINARLPPNASTDQIPDMLQALLIERFGLEIRRETKEQNVYALLVGSGGAKLKPAEVKADDKSPRVLGPDGKPRAVMTYGFPPGGTFITAPSASLASLVGLMSFFTVRPIVDMTGIDGQYEFRLTFAPERNGNLNTSPGPGPDGATAAVEPFPSVFDAVKQYGLRLEARKAPVEMLTVTHIEKTPTEN